MFAVGTSLLNWSTVLCYTYKVITNASVEILKIFSLQLQFVLAS